MKKDQLRRVSLVIWFWAKATVFLQVSNSIKIILFPHLKQILYQILKILCFVLPKLTVL